MLRLVVAVVLVVLVELRKKILSTVKLVTVGHDLAQGMSPRHLKKVSTKNSVNNRTDNLIQYFTQKCQFKMKTKF